MLRPHTQTLKPHTLLGPLPPIPANPSEAVGAPVRRRLRVSRRTCVRYPARRGLLAGGVEPARLWHTGWGKGPRVLGLGVGAWMGVGGLRVEGWGRCAGTSRRPIGTSCCTRCRVRLADACNVPHATGVVRRTACCCNQAHSRRLTGPVPGGVTPCIHGHAHARGRYSTSGPRCNFIRRGRDAAPL